MNRTLGSLKLWQAAIFFFIAPIVISIVINAVTSAKTEKTA